MTPIKRRSKRNLDKTSQARGPKDVVEDYEAIFSNEEDQEHLHEEYEEDWEPK